MVSILRLLFLKARHHSCERSGNRCASIDDGNAQYQCLYNTRAHTTRATTAQASMSLFLTLAFDAILQR